MLIIKQPRQDMKQRQKVYKDIIKLWVQKVKIQKLEADQFFSQFLKLIERQLFMPIASDSCMVPIIIQKIKRKLQPTGLPTRNPQKLNVLNILIDIVRVLYEHLFIVRLDVAQIMQHIKLSEQLMFLFLESDVQPLEERWEKCIRYRMDVFWFIVAYKSIDISLQISLYEKTIKCKSIRNRQCFVSYYQGLKEKKKQFAMQELQKTNNSSKFSNQLSASGLKLQISLIHKQIDEDEKNLSLYFG